MVDDFQWESLIQILLQYRQTFFQQKISGTYFLPTIRCRPSLDKCLATRLQYHEMGLSGACCLQSDTRFWDLPEYSIEDDVVGLHGCTLN